MRWRYWPWRPVKPAAPGLTTSQALCLEAGFEDAAPQPTARLVRDALLRLNPALGLDWAESLAEAVVFLEDTRHWLDAAEVARYALSIAPGERTSVWLR